jgi:hypothetical protein
VKVFELVGIMALVAFSLTAFGAVLGSRIQQMQLFSVVVQFLRDVLGLPVRDDVSRPGPRNCRKLDPLTDGVDPIRRGVFSQLSVSKTALRLYNPAEWAGPAGSS